MSKIMHAEADEISYRVASEHEKTAYIFHGPNSSVDFKNKYTKTEITKHYAEKGLKLDHDYTLERYVILEKTLDEIIDTVDNYVERLHKVILPTEETVSKVCLWLSPSDHSNFRYKVAKTVGPKGVGYKADRHLKPKPKYLLDVKQHLMDVWGAEEIRGYEADDALSMYYKKGETVSCHNDKDISMVPDWHYDHVGDYFYYVPDDWHLCIREIYHKKDKLMVNGLPFFYGQLLMGDSTDNIPGIRGTGPAKAAKALRDCADEAQAFQAVLSMYQQQYEENAVSILKEVADLVWMVRDDLLTGSQYLESRGFL